METRSSTVDCSAEQKEVNIGCSHFKCEMSGNKYTCKSRRLKSVSVERPFQCVECLATFTQLSALYRHKRIHTGAMPYTCQDCGRSFNQSSNFKRHRRIHTGEEPFKCDVCGWSYKDSSALNKHKKKHLREKLKAGKVANHPTREIKIQNIPNVVTPEKRYQCKECLKRFAHASALYRHRKIHVRERAKNAEQSPAVVETAPDTLIHINLETGKQQLKCDDCGALLSHISALIRHKRIHTGIKPYTCEDCGRSFNQTSNYKRHRKVHIGKAPHKCDICGWSYKDLSSLNRHKNKHIEEKNNSINKVPIKPNLREPQNGQQRNYNEKAFECIECGNRYAHSSALYRHKRIHVKEKAFEIEQAKNIVPDSSILINLETGKQQLKCDDCGVLLSHISALKRHKRIHTGEKPYACEDCGKSFNQSSNFKRHLAVHKSEKPYKCEECGEGFDISSDFIEHIIVHTEEKPFKCDECEMAFSSASSLSDHKEKHKEQTGIDESFKDAIEILQIGGRPIQKCKVCNDDLKFSCFLNKHMEEIESEKPSKSDVIEIESDDEMDTNIKLEPDDYEIIEIDDFIQLKD